MTRKVRSPTPTSPGPASDTDDDRELLDRILDRQAQFTRLVLEMRAAAGDGAFQKINELVRKFYFVRAEQILDYSIRMLAYARVSLKQNDPKETIRLEVVRQMILNDIEETGKFCERYDQRNVRSDNVAGFLQDLDRLSVSLARLEAYTIRYLDKLYKMLRERSD